jgi:glucosamine--fructose-6-phosphate aminotransferase (isomerizing)
VCGIVGYVGDREAAKVVWDSLCRLEYRGYDSAGIAVLNGDGIKTAKCKGRLADLAAKLSELPHATQAIGHTRWATHGAPNDNNAHPHRDCTGDIVLVHNGIIENHRELRERLLANGHRIKTETDTELAAHLIEENYAGDLADAVMRSVAELEGTMALVVVHAHEPGRIVAYREKSPLIVGLGEGENFLASDIPAILPYTQKVLVVNDGEIVIVQKDEVLIRGKDNGCVDRKPVVVDLKPEAAEKAGFAHFMLKEIYEQPEALDRVASGRIRDGMVAFEKSEFGLTDQEVRGLSKVWLMACGTAYHACLVGKTLIERLAGIPAEVMLASEFRYSEPIVPPGSLCVVVSQSGETIDTLTAMREARELGASRVLAVVNQPMSSLAREADDVMYQRAGPEISVCSTKAYTTQVACLGLLAIHLGAVRGRLTKDQVRKLTSDIRSLPEKAQGALRSSAVMQRLAKEMAQKEDIFFIGRGMDYMAVMEGQLKLKEISYIHAEAYAAGELKHGTLALIGPGVPVIAVLTDPEIAPKTASNIMEVKARGGRVVAIGSEECLAKVHLADGDVAVTIPTVNPLFSPAISVIAMQLLAYYVALERGTDIDKPRNLAKSVTVE